MLCFGRRLHPDRGPEGATRNDEDNFWVAELTEGTSDWRLLDEDKAVWNSVEGLAFDYEALSVAE